MTDAATLDSEFFTDILESNKDAREGELPCPTNYSNCEYPHARND